MKICPVGAELFCADRQTNMKLIVAFRNFAKASKNVYKYRSIYYFLLSYMFRPVDRHSQRGAPILQNKIHLLLLYNIKIA